MNKSGRKKIIALLLAAVCAAGQLDAPIRQKDVPNTIPTAIGSI